MVVLLRFNQPVNAPDILAHVRASLQPHDWNEPVLANDARTRLNACSSSPRMLAKFSPAPALFGSPPPQFRNVTGEASLQTQPFPRSPAGG